MKPYSSIIKNISPKNKRFKLHDKYFVKGLNENDTNFIIFIQDTAVQLTNMCHLHKIIKTDNVLIDKNEKNNIYSF